MERGGAALLGADDQELRQAARHAGVPLVQLRARVSSDEVGVHRQVAQAEQVEHLRTRRGGGGVEAWRLGLWGCGGAGLRARDVATWEQEGEYRWGVDS